VSRWSDLFDALSRADDSLDTVDTLIASALAADGVSQSVKSVPAQGGVPEATVGAASEHLPQSAPGEALAAWSGAEEERSGIVEYDAGAPRAWAEALTRLDPHRPPGDVPARRWVQFINDCGRFIDQGWAARAETLSWRALDLFGCDRDRPFARIDRLGLLWLTNGDMLVEMSETVAIVETKTGARLTFRRRPAEPGQVVLAWEQLPKDHGS